ncbi:pentapeptide repeat-containing protein [Micromonospora sp. RP3T]|uniref:pentapeptide repeat-containing protein n=1 Tax=Micromonospora sp. RP3T TaxID=2135446 RepID=UPI003D75C039
MKLWKVVAGAVVIALVAAAAIFFVGLWIAGFPRLQHDGFVRPSTLFEMAKIALAVVAGIGGVVALVTAYRRQQVLEAGNTLAEIANDRAAEESGRNAIRLREERFARASEQLGSDKPAVRLAGAYALSALADDWPEGRQQCIDVLCAYVRLPHRLSEEEEKPELRRVGPYRRSPTSRRALIADREFMEDEEVRKTIMRTISAHLRADSPTSWCGLNFDFTGATIRYADFSEAVFSAGLVSFRNATFPEANLSFYRAKFSGAYVSFHQAKFINTSTPFIGASITAGRLSFGAAVFEHSHINFRRSSLEGGRLSFGSATFLSSRVHLTRSRFDGTYVSFSHSKIASGFLDFGASEIRASTLNFEHARLSGGRIAFLGTAFTAQGGFKFKNAKIESGTVSFNRTVFNGQRMSFGAVTMSGGALLFLGSRFESGSVSFRQAALLAGTIEIKRCDFVGGLINFNTRRAGSLVVLTDWSDGIPSAVHNASRVELVLAQPAAPHQSELQELQEVFDDEDVDFALDED